MLEARDNDECCTVMERTGFGVNLCGCGWVMCAPGWLRMWAMKKKGYYR
jgi:hypothetical protein